MSGNDLAQKREQFETWISYVRSLDGLTEQQQLTPIGEGKWAVRDVVAHMWKWDEFFWTHAIQPLTEGKPLTYHHLDFNAFNESAKNECRLLPWTEVAEQAARRRETIAAAIRGVDEAEYGREFRDADGRPFSITEYLLDFVQHDAHHRAQIEEALA